MLFNPPPATCDHCRTAADWILVYGPERVVALADGRELARRGRVCVCRRCGHTVPLSRENAQ
ncbi:MAG: hypothetical protein ACREN4_08270 [Candidatus Dormibacteria bacterium]